MLIQPFDQRDVAERSRDLQRSDSAASRAVNSPRCLDHLRKPLGDRRDRLLRGRQPRRQRQDAPLQARQLRFNFADVGRAADDQRISRFRRLPGFEQHERSGSRAAACRPATPAAGPAVSAPRRRANRYREIGRRRFARRPATARDRPLPARPLARGDDRIGLLGPFGQPRGADLSVSLQCSGGRRSPPRRRRPIVW